MGKTYNPEFGKEATFMDFKKIISDYENGYKSYDDIGKEQLKISISATDVPDDDINANINRDIIIYYQSYSLAVLNLMKKQL